MEPRDFSRDQILFEVRYRQVAHEVKRFLIIIIGCCIESLT